jgi:LPS-assembly lipoprotein
MSLRDRHDAKPGRASPCSVLRAGLFALVLLPGLAACGGGGFKPMYAAHGGQTVGSKMAKVSVTTIPGRVGQQVRNELIFRTTGGGGEAVDKAYRLDIILRQRLTSAQVDVQGNAETQIYHIDADFQLIDNRSSQVVFKGQSFGRASFQRFQTIYSNVRAKRDAEDRTARTIAGDIAGRVEAFLSR